MKPDFIFKIIAIDGPTGVGKSTIARKLAEQEGFLYVDTGAMYRCIAWNWQLLKNTNPRISLEEIVATTQIRLHPDGRIFCNDIDVTHSIRSEEISSLASDVSKSISVRESIVELQKQLVAAAVRLGDCDGAVLEGRDIGTVVFPEAYRKFFLTADRKIRANRRHRDLLARGEDVAFESVLSALAARDFQDENRKIAPLRKAEDAIYLDSSSLSIDEVVVQMSDFIHHTS